MPILENIISQFTHSQKMAIQTNQQQQIQQTQQTQQLKPTAATTAAILQHQ